MIQLVDGRKDRARAKPRPFEEKMIRLEDAIDYLCNLAAGLSGANGEAMVRHLKGAMEEQRVHVSGIIESMRPKT